MIKAVIFDYDGVLVDTLSGLKKVYKVIGQELNIPEWTNLPKKVDSFSVDWHETCRRYGLPTKEDREKVEEIFIREVNKFENRPQLFPGIRQVMESLSQYKRAVLSNNFRSQIEKTFKHHNIGFFDSIVGGEDGKQKPDPELFNITMKRLNVKPEETVYVCDMKEEIDGAHNANIKKVIAVTYGYHSKEHLEDAQPDHIVDTPEQILEIING